MQRIFTEKINNGLQWRCHYQSLAISDELLQTNENSRSETSFCVFYNFRWNRKGAKVKNNKTGHNSCHE